MGHGGSVVHGGPRAGQASLSFQGACLETTILEVKKCQLIGKEEAEAGGLPEGA